jgi:phosphohistidine swiveling domain-containing protein
VAHAASAGVTDRVTFHGLVDDGRKVQLLATAWVLALPSQKEGWGLVVMEAASLGVPTVAFASAGGVRESVVDGVAVGAFHWIESGDLSTVPAGAIVGIPRAFDGELTGEPDHIAGIVDCHGEPTGNATTVARDGDIPMITENRGECLTL